MSIKGTETQELYYRTIYGLYIIHRRDDMCTSLDCCGLRLCFVVGHG